MPTVKQLKEEAKNRGYIRYSRLKKAELIDLLEGKNPEYWSDVTGLAPYKLYDGVDSQANSQANSQADSHQTYSTYQIFEPPKLSSPGSPQPFVIAPPGSPPPAPPLPIDIPPGYSPDAKTEEPINLSGDKLPQIKQSHITNQTININLGHNPFEPYERPPQPEILRPILAAPRPSPSPAPGSPPRPSPSPAHGSPPPPDDDEEDEEDKKERTRIEELKKKRDDEFKAASELSKQSEKKRNKAKAKLEAIYGQQAKTIAAGPAPPKKTPEQIAAEKEQLNRTLAALAEARK